MAQESEIWQRVNALGGTPVSATDEYDRGYNNAILDVLEIIERVEGKTLRAADPAPANRIVINCKTEADVDRAFAFIGRHYGVRL